MKEISQTKLYMKWYARLKGRMARMRIAVRIRRMQSGNSGDVKPVGNGVFELRFNFGPGYRVYYTERGNEIIILLAGGDKSTQQLDIEAAKRLAASI